jgi:hypothetical protein
MLQPFPTSVAVHVLPNNSGEESKTRFEAQKSSTIALRDA